MRYAIGYILSLVLCASAYSQPTGGPITDTIADKVNSTIGDVRNPSDVKGLLKWAGEVDISGGTVIDITGKAYGVGYWSPLSYGQRGWGAKAKDAKPYFQTPVGVAFRDGEKPRYLGGLMIRPGNVLEAILRRVKPKLAKSETWNPDRFLRQPFPEIAVGPAMLFPRKRDQIGDLPVLIISITF